MKLGIDFGTTNSAAAVIGNDGRPLVLPLDAGTKNAGTLRTVLYVERDGNISIGSEAIALNRAQNVGRLPRFTRQWITEIDVVITEGATIVLDVFSDVDADAPGRLLHSLKGPLASTYEGTTLFGKHYSLEALIAEFLSRLRFRIEQATGETVTRAVLGRPVNFANAHSPEDNAKAEARLRDAATLAGFTDVMFEMEPIAAGLSYGAHHTMRAGDHALVFDFGGGTLDVAIIRVEAGNQQRVLATGGVGILRPRALQACGAAVAGRAGAMGFAAVALAGAPDGRLVRLAGCGGAVQPAYAGVFARGAEQLHRADSTAGAGRLCVARLRLRRV